MSCIPTQEHCGIHMNVTTAEYIIKQMSREEKKERKNSNSRKGSQPESRYIEHWSSMVSISTFCHIFSNNYFKCDVKKNTDHEVRF